ncbi:hypothetical protein Avbf_01528 [Armadillidium vulgare]|nr:hypothetical protein Avbf_01528 [Armadillidium vulgare]
MHHIIAAVDNLNHSIMSMDHSSHGSHSGHDSNMPMMMMPNDEIATTESTNSLHSNHVGAMSGMKMYFHFGVEETILFYGWKTSTVGGLIGSMNAHPEPKSPDTNAASHHSVHNIVLSYVNIHDIQCMAMFSLNPRGWSRIFLIWMEEICRRRRDRTLSLTNRTTTLETIINYS